MPYQIEAFFYVEQICNVCMSFSVRMNALKSKKPEILEGVGLSVAAKNFC